MTRIEGIRFMRLAKSVLPRILGVLLTVEFLFVFVEAQKPRNDQNKDAVHQTPIQLVIQTPRKTWRAGESIEILAYLENVSQKYAAYYVGRELFSLFSIDPYHYIELSIKDSRNREVPLGRMASAGYDKGESIAEKLHRAYVYLSPGNIYGLKRTIGYKLAPGRYSLTAVYREVQALYWSEQERKALPTPVWTEKLVSNTLIITITR